MTVVTPADSTPGPVIVCITAEGGTAQTQEPFTYVGIPAITNLSPSSGSTNGGTTVTITGSGLTATSAVTFGGNSGTNIVNYGDTEITVVTPASTLGGGGVGAVNVVVTSAGGTSSPGTFTYVPSPTVNGISPTSGPPGGGETVYIQGTNLCNATSVLFGTTAGTVTNISPNCTTLTVTEPAGQGTVPVFVNTAGGTAQSPENFTYIGPGYWEAASDGGVFAFGGARFLGSVPGELEPGQKLESPIVAMADTPDHEGYWLFAADGGVFAFGDAPFFGSVPGALQPGQVLNAPIVAAEATPDGGGYRMFAADGGVFAFGDAAFEGSLPGENIIPSQPITGAVAYPYGPNANPDAAGYWLVASDGGIFTFGNAPFEGSAAGQIFGKVVAMATTPTGDGYYLFLAGGAVAHEGDATAGLGGASGLNSPIVFGQATSTGKGYWLFAADGGVFVYGDAPFEGSLGGIKLDEPIAAAIAFGAN
jgi:hypothetical protein